MRIGVPRETKEREYRVAMVPEGARVLVEQGHEVRIETEAGLGSGFADEAYVAAGAKMVAAAEVWAESELVVKVKEPNANEIASLSEGQTVFAYLHLAAAPELAQGLLASGATAIAYETVQHPDGSFPVLAPMSEVAGRLAAQIGATLLQKEHGGKGLLLGGVPGVHRGRVTILGAGTVGINALRIAHALGAEVDVLDLDMRRLTYVYDLFHGELNTLYSNPANIARSVRTSDLVIGAVYVSGRRAPLLVPEGLVADMEPGSVAVDVAVDQGGCIETIRPTTHSDPTYVEHGVIHYGVANMPGAVPRTSTFALTNVTLPLVELLAGEGIRSAIEQDPVLASGVNVWGGKLAHPGAAESLGLPCEDFSALL